jgi:ABC-type nitrate/sulfonate/bicarbonate transport system substrate-binding protein
MEMFSARMSQERKAGRLRSGIFAAFGGALIGCLCPAAAFAADNVGTVTLGWLKSTANLIAVEAPKLSSKHGLKIESVNFNNGVDIATALVNGQIDTALLTPLHLIRAIDGRVDFVQISGNARGNTIVVAAKKLGLAENDWNGLKAANKTKKLRVASSRGSVNELLGVAEFAMNGIDVDKDIDLVNVASFAQHPQALRSGEFDMIITVEPLSTLVITEGVGTLFNRPFNTKAGDLNTNYLVRGDWLTKNAPKAQAFVKSVVEAASLLSSNKQVELEAAKQLTGMNPEVLTLALANNRYDVGDGLAQMQELARIAFQRQYTTRDVAAELPKAVNNTFVKEAGAGR